MKSRPIRFFIAALSIAILSLSRSAAAGPGEQMIPGLLPVAGLPLEAIQTSSRAKTQAALSDAGDYLWHTFYGLNGAAGGGITVRDGSELFISASTGYTWYGPEGQLPLNMGGNDWNLTLLRLKGSGLIYSVSGDIVDFNGHPLPGVKVTAGTGYNAVTDSQGYYMIREMFAGTCLLMPVLPRYVFSPPTRLITLPPDAVEQEFTGSFASLVYMPFCRH